MKTLISIAEAAKLLGVDITTLRRWEAKGKLKSLRTLGGHRRYDKAVILEVRDGQ